MSPAFVLESLQCELRAHTFLPHPAVVRRLNSWDLAVDSVMHFLRAKIQDERKWAGRYDMTDFCRSNSSQCLQSQPIWMNCWNH